MASYVVRIYRAEEKPRQRLTGVVMGVDDEARHPFRNVSELWSILSCLERFEEREGRSPRRFSSAPLFLE